MALPSPVPRGGHAELAALKLDLNLILAKKFLGFEDIAFVSPVHTHVSCREVWRMHCGGKGNGVVIVSSFGGVWPRPESLFFFFSSAHKRW